MRRLGWIYMMMICGLGHFSLAQTMPVFEEQVEFSIPKTLFFTGEKIWLSIQVQSPSGPTESRIGYAELWNRYGESVALAKIPLESGVAFNFLKVPDHLPSDQYLLRVFTRVSPFQNLDKGLVQEFVTIFNPSIPPEVVTQRREQAVSDQSTSIAFSQKTIRSGEEITLTYSGQDSIVEWSVAIPNPFLCIGGKLISGEIYDPLKPRKSVPEFFGHIIEAKVGEQAPDSTVNSLYYLSLHGEKSVLFTDRPDQQGTLFVDTGGFRHWDHLVAQRLDDLSMTNFEIVSPGPQTQFKAGFQFPELQINPEDAPLLKEYLQASQIEGYFVQEYQGESFPVVTGFVTDRTFLLDDYNRFEDVETHLREYVPEVLVRTRDKKKELRVLNALQNRAFSENPLLLVDAMPVFDVNSLMRFNPAKLEKMEILTRYFYLNEEVYSGVISFSSYQNDFGGFPLPANAIYVPYPGIQAAVRDQSSLFLPSNKLGADMDWRTILYWSRTGTPDKSVKITAPSLKGTFRIVLKILDSEGKIKEEFAEFEVK
jgi:hypothetical protein